MPTTSPTSQWARTPISHRRHRSLTGLEGEAFRDALVAGFVPGIALGWSWPDTLRHALALGAAWNSVGELDVQAYEEALIAVKVDQSPRHH